MVKEILTNAGFEEDVTFRETRFVKPPRQSYVVYLISYTSRGSDQRNMVRDCTTLIELYAYKADPDAEARIEKQLDERGLEYRKDDRYWIQEEQLFQTVYTVEHTEKI